MSDGSAAQDAPSLRPVAGGEPVEGGVEQGDGVLVGPLSHRLLGRVEGVRGRLLGRRARLRQEEVSCQLGARGSGTVHPLQGLADPLVETGAEVHGEAVVEDLPDHRVGEGVRGRDPRDLGQELGPDGGIEHVEEQVGVDGHDIGHHVGPELCAPHRRRFEDLPSKVAETGDAPEDHAADPFGDHQVGAGQVPDRPRVANAECPGLGEVAQHLA